MRTEHLEILVELAKTQSMSLAGKYLHISHQGISSSIARLENELGVILINRTKNGVYLTETGEKYVNLINQFLQDLAKLKQESVNKPCEKPSKLEGSLTIFSSHPFSIDILPKVTSIFCRKYPKVRLVMRDEHTEQVVKEVEAGNSEIGLVMQLKEGVRESLVNKENIKFEKLFSNPIYALVANTLPISTRKSISIKELLHYPLVVYLDSKNIIIRHILANKDIYGEPTVMIDSNNVTICSKAISEGVAVGFSNKIALNSDHDEIPENVVAIPISDKLNFVCGYVVSSRCGLSPAAEAFIEILKMNC